jgi:hypothetical protein
MVREVIPLDRELLFMRAFLWPNETCDQDIAVGHTSELAVSCLVSRGVWVMGVAWG